MGWWVNFVYCVGGAVTICQMIRKPVHDRRVRRVPCELGDHSRKARQQLPLARRSRQTAKRQNTDELVEIKIQHCLAWILLCPPGGVDFDTDVFIRRTPRQPHKGRAVVVRGAAVGVGKRVAVQRGPDRSSADLVDDLESPHIEVDGGFHCELSLRP